LKIDINSDSENSDKGSEYIPSEEEIQNSLNSIKSPRKRSTKRSTKLLQKSTLNITASSASSFDISQVNVVNGKLACNDEVMYVQKSNVKSSKQNYCVFCMKPQSQLPRHLEMVHKNEPEVKKFAVLPKNNIERKKIIDTIRKAGNFKFNTNANFNNGQLIVCRRPTEKSNKTATDFIACANCKGFFAKSSIRYRSRVCLKKDNFKKNKTIMIMGRKIISRIHQLANKTLREIVIPVMREDEILRVVRFDELLILYGNKMSMKYRAQHQHDMIRSRLRLLGRFLLALRKINKDVKDFKSVYQPRIYDDCHLCN